MPPTGMPARSNDAWSELPPSRTRRARAAGGGAGRPRSGARRRRRRVTRRACRPCRGSRRRRSGAARPRRGRRRSAASRRGRSPPRPRSRSAAGGRDRRAARRPRSTAATPLALSFMPGPAGTESRCAPAITSPASRADLADHVRRPARLGDRPHPDATAGAGQLAGRRDRDPHAGPLQRAGDRLGGGDQRGGGAGALGVERLDPEEAGPAPDDRDLALAQAREVARRTAEPDRAQRGRRRCRRARTAASAPSRGARRRSRAAARSRGSRAPRTAGA